MNGATYILPAVASKKEPILPSAHHLPSSSSHDRPVFTKLRICLLISLTIMILGWITLSLTSVDGRVFEIHVSMDAAGRVGMEVDLEVVNSKPLWWQTAHHIAKSSDHKTAGVGPSSKSGLAFYRTHGKHQKPN